MLLCADIFEPAGERGAARRGDRFAHGASPQAVQLRARLRARRGARAKAFTLIEVLAALMLMAIVIPVAMQGMGIASRAGVMGQRKAAAMRVADRLLNEYVIAGQASQMGTSGTVAEGAGTYDWSLETQTWPEDAMLQLTMRVTFTVQGESFSVTASTLIDPVASNDPLAASAAEEPIE